MVSILSSPFHSILHSRRGVRWCGSEAWRSPEEQWHAVSGMHVSRAVGFGPVVIATVFILVRHQSVGFAQAESSEGRLSARDSYLAVHRVETFAGDSGMENPQFITPGGNVGEADISP